MLGGDFGNWLDDWREGTESKDITGQKFCIAFDGNVVDKSTENGLDTDANAYAMNPCGVYGIQYLVRGVLPGSRGK
jgi:hypothetical protein